MRLRRVAILITGTALAHRSDRFALAAFESRLPIRRRGEAQSTRFLLYTYKKKDSVVYVLYIGTRFLSTI